jgi:hypothetical protein
MKRYGQETIVKKHVDKTLIKNKTSSWFYLSFWALIRAAFFYIPILTQPSSLVPWKGPFTIGSDTAPCPLLSTRLSNAPGVIIHITLLYTIRFLTNLTSAAGPSGRAL